MLVLLDLDLVALRKARKASPDAALIQGNITRLPFRAQFDLIVARHPNVDQRPRDWAYAFQHSQQWLSERGILLITAYAEPEIERIVGWLASCNLVPAALEFARLSPPGLTGRDRLVLAYQNESRQPTAPHPIR